MNLEWPWSLLGTEYFWKMCLDLKDYYKVVWILGESATSTSQNPHLLFSFWVRVATRVYFFMASAYLRPDAVYLICFPPRETCWFSWIDLWPHVRLISSPGFRGHLILAIDLFSHLLRLTCKFKFKYYSRNKCYHLQETSKEKMGTWMQPSHGWSLEGIWLPCLLWGREFPKAWVLGDSIIWP